MLKEEERQKKHKSMYGLMAIMAKSKKQVWHTWRKAFVAFCGAYISRDHDQNQLFSPLACISLFSMHGIQSRGCYTCRWSAWSSREELFEELKQADVLISLAIKASLEEEESMSSTIKDHWGTLISKPSKRYSVSLCSVFCYLHIGSWCYELLHLLDLVAFEAYVWIFILSSMIV